MILIYSQFLPIIWLTTVIPHHATYESVYYAETYIICKLFNKQFYRNNYYFVVANKVKCFQIKISNNTIFKCSDYLE